MSKVCPVVVGHSYEMKYPEHNYAGLFSEFEPRRILVKRIRDCRINPVEPEWIKLRPTLNRGRWLAICDDLDRGAERKFYVDRMKDIVEIFEEPDPMRFVVIRNDRVRFETPELMAAIGYRIGAAGGAIYGRMGD